ncbi:hypothetical protein CDEST_07307 [Colletotrichum destructivum]|uniref:Uncharacterized protein n=1 Tax=Colletotrichum destructivum TaxID=34406 RepID=A0AAX4IFQ1_9PEZI|nr:hypothetical protein CDEST_07307 [Colletotrichum destructivum]
MAAFRPIDMAVSKPKSRAICAPESQRADFIIFHAVYYPITNEAFAKTIKWLAVYAEPSVDDNIFLELLQNRNPRDPLPNQELWIRY